MAWFTTWWDNLTLLQQVFACAAIPASIVLALQTILLLFGFAGHSADHGEACDNDADMEHDVSHHDSGIRLMTVRGLVAFFAVGGWLGVALGQTQMRSAVIVALAFAGGFAALFAVALVLKWSLALQENGTLSLTNAVGSQARVYLTIPPARTGSGKVMVTVQEQLMELEAMTDEKIPLLTGAQVQIIAVDGNNLLVVAPVQGE